MDRDKLISRLNDKYNQLEEQRHKYDNCVRLPRKMYYHSQRDFIDCAAKQMAIKFAIELLDGTIFTQIDLYKYALMTISPRRSDFQEMLNKSASAFPNTRREVARFIVEMYLPICKKQVLMLIG